MADAVEVSARLQPQCGPGAKSGLQQACNDAGRPRSSVQLLPITKYVDATTTGWLHQCLPVPLGESRPQVIWEKAPDSSQVEWHLVGHLAAQQGSSYAAAGEYDPFGG